MSSQFSGGVRAITLVKLTFSLAAVSPATTPSAVIRAGRGSDAAAATPSIAPSALAPLSPSIDRSPRSSGSSAAAAPAGAAAAARACGPARASARLASAPTLIARPGRRSNRFIRFALAATSAALTPTSAIRRGADGTGPGTALRPLPRQSSSSAAASPAAPIPAILIAPVVTSPLASAPR